MAVQRGEIHFVNLNPVQGREQAGRRPVLVLSADAINRLPLVVTVVVGTKGENVTRDYPTNVRVSATAGGWLRRRTLRRLRRSRKREADDGCYEGQVLSMIAGRFAARAVALWAATSQTMR